METEVFEVQWTGTYPCLCVGEWVIKKNKKNVSRKIPIKKRSDYMNTYKKYYTWHFQDWVEQWESYEDGLKFDDWVKENLWIDKICDSDAERRELYDKINKEDWRHNSCGGCI